MNTNGWDIVEKLGGRHSLEAKGACHFHASVDDVRFDLNRSYDQSAANKVQIRFCPASGTFTVLLYHSKGNGVDLRLISEKHLILPSELKNTLGRMLAGNRHTH